MGDYKIIATVAPAVVIPNAPNITSVSASAYYGLVNNGSTYGLQGTITLPTGSSAYAHLREIDISATLPDGSVQPVGTLYAAFSGSTVTFKGPPTLPQTGAAQTVTLTFVCKNDNGIATPSPVTASVTVQASAVTGFTSAAETGVRYVDPTNAATRLLSMTVGFVPIMNGAQVPQNVTYLISKDNAATFTWVGWQPMKSVGQQITFPELAPGAGQTWAVAAVAGAQLNGSVPITAANLTTLYPGAVVSNPFTVIGLSLPAATLVSTLTVASGAGGSFPYNVVRPDGSQYYSIPSISYTDVITDPNAFFFRVTAQDLDSSHNPIGPEQPFFGSQVGTASATQTSTALQGDYGTNGYNYTRTGNIAYVRLKLYACNRIDMTAYSFSDALCAVKQTGIGSAAGYVDVLVATSGSMPPGAIPGARVTGTVALATSATSATTAGYSTSAGSAGSATSVPGSGVTGTITASTSGTQVTLYQVLDSGSNLVMWAGLHTDGGTSRSGIWAKNAWFGGSDPTSAKIYMDSLGNAYFTGTINSGTSINSPAINGGSLSITTSSGTVSIGTGTTGVNVTYGSTTITLSGTGLYVNQAGSVSSLDGLGVSLSGVRLYNSGGQWSGGVNTTSSVQCGNLYVQPGYSVSVNGSTVINSSGQFIGNGVSCSSYSVSCYSLSVGAGGISSSGAVSVNGYSAINTSGQFVGAGVNCASYGVTCYSVSAGGGGVSTTGTVNAAGFTLNGVSIMGGLCTNTWTVAVITPVWVGWISAYTSTGAFLGKVLYC